MVAIKKYFKTEFQFSMFKLKHDDLSDFYLSSFQKSRSPVPLLCLRIITFLGCVGILLSSTILMRSRMSFAHWLIFLTHWGVILIVLTSGCAVLVSLKAYVGDPNDSPRDSQLFVQMYWILSSISVPVAFLISIVYWSFLNETVEDFPMDPVLDVFIHGVNAIVMLVLLLSSRQPWRLLHFLYPLAFCIVYLIFTIIYYFAGGLSPFGVAYIYPILDWSSPGIATITVVGTAVFLVFVHVLVVLISLGRDKLSKRYFRNINSINIYNDAYN